MSNGASWRDREPWKGIVKEGYLVGAKRRRSGHISLRFHALWISETKLYKSRIAKLDAVMLLYMVENAALVIGRSAVR